MPGTFQKLTLLLKNDILTSGLSVGIMDEKNFHGGSTLVQRCFHVPYAGTLHTGLDTFESRVVQMIDTSPESVTVAIIKHYNAILSILLGSRAHTSLALLGGGQLNISAYIGAELRDRLIITR